MKEQFEKNYGEKGMSPAKALQWEEEKIGCWRNNTEFFHVLRLKPPAKKISSLQKGTQNREKQLYLSFLVHCFSTFN